MSDQSMIDELLAQSLSEAQGQVDDMQEDVDAAVGLTAGEQGGIDMLGDVDLDVVVDFWGHEDRGEGGMAPVTGIEGRLAHQAVHAGLGAQPPEGVLSLEFHRGALDARHLTAGHLDQFSVETPGFSPAQVHAEQHLGPVY